MWGTLSPIGIGRKYRNYLILSLVVSLVLIPIFDGAIIQRDRNRNMLYGELFLTKGVSVYSLTDQELNETYVIPSDHLLTGVLNVSYEYPLITLVFFAGLAAIEPGIYGPHYLANAILTILVHLNLILFLYAGQEYLNKRWFQQFFLLYYVFGLSLAVGLGKAEPLADLFWLLSIVLYRNQKILESSALLGVAAQTKIYPALALPLMMSANPLSLIIFLVMFGILLLPMILGGTSYDTLFQHMINSSSYASIISNPFYIGLTFQNPLAIIAPIVLVLAFCYSTLEPRKVGPLIIPTSKLRTRDHRSIIVYALPLALIFFSWVLIWYYYWFILLVMYFRNEDDQAKYRYIFIGFLFAHFLGLLLNFEYFLSGPILEFLGHLKFL